MADQFLLDRITRYEEIIVSVENAIDTLAIANHASYTIDSGQTMQKVSRLDLDSLRLMSDDYMSKRDTLRARCGLSRAVVTVIPGC